jgi:hypothetical protein
MKQSISSKIAKEYVRDQALYAQAQERLASNTDITVVSMQKGTFYVKSLASLSVCNHLLINNAQLKEINYHKIKMLHSRISEVATRIENFKALLRLVANKSESGDE